ncbi:MAG: hydrogenase maturation nickel metallochaperone HypA [bacterium]|nr:hydrogenase maturation nickel metallochaperone HypA [bacterium]
MHELSIARALLDTALATASEHQATRIGCIHLRIGGLCQVVAESLRGAFEILAEGSIAKDATLEIETVPSVWRCAECGRTLAVESAPEVCCCGSRDRSFEGSDELTMTSMDLECADED